MFVPTEKYLVNLIVIYVIRKLKFISISKCVTFGLGTASFTAGVYITRNSVPNSNFPPLQVKADENSV